MPKFQMLYCATNALKYIKSWSHRLPDDGSCVNRNMLEGLL